MPKFSRVILFITYLALHIILEKILLLTLLSVEFEMEDIFIGHTENKKKNGRVQPSLIRKKECLGHYLFLLYYNYILCIPQDMSTVKLIGKYICTKHWNLQTCMNFNFTHKFFIILIRKNIRENSDIIFFYNWRYFL